MVIIDLPKKEIAIFGVPQATTNLRTMIASLIAEGKS